MMSAIAARIKTVLNRTQWNLCHPRKEDFVLMQWERNFPSSLFSVIWRLVIAGYFLGWTIVKFTWEVRYTMTYLTNWSFTLITVDATLKAFLCMVEYSQIGCWKGQGRNSTNATAESIIDDLPWVHKMSWILTSVTHATALVVTTAYWTMIYDSAIEPYVTAANFAVHATNAIYVVLEVLTNRRPIFVGHIVYLWAYIFIYTAFSLIYYLAGGTDPNGNHYIYWFLDWQKPGQTLAFAPVFTVAPLVFHCLLWWMTRLRQRVWRRCFGEVEEAHISGTVVIPYGPGGKQRIYTVSDKV